MEVKQEFEALKEGLKPSKSALRDEKAKQLINQAAEHLGVCLGKQPFKSREKVLLKTATEHKEATICRICLDGTAMVISYPFPVLYFNVETGECTNGFAARIEKMEMR